jgi:hypothetical protein
MNYSRCVETAIKELSHEDLVSYAVGATLLLAQIAHEEGGPGTKMFVTKERPFGLSREDSAKQRDVSERVSKRCKELEQLQN